MSCGTLRLPGGAKASVSGEIGECVYLAHDTVPVHCLACNGAAVSRLVYASSLQRSAPATEPATARPSTCRMLAE